MKAEKKNILSTTLDQIITMMSAGLQKAKPKLLIEIFSILRGMKQQGMMTDDQVSQVKESLTVFGKSFMHSKLPVSIKKNFKKVLSFYDVKVDFGKMKKMPRVEKNGLENGNSGGGGGNAKEEKKVKKVKKVKEEKEEEEEKEEKEESELPEEAEKKKKKKKKKSKDAEQRKKERKLESAGADDETSAPSFSEFLVDTTQVYTDPNKKKKMKRRNSENPAPQEKKKKKSES